MHAWFSKKQAPLTGIVVYARADNSVVECTEVSESATYTANWDDAEYRGSVVRYVGRVTKPIVPVHFFTYENY